MTSDRADGEYFLAGRNINGYFAYQLFSNLAFWLPIYAVFFLARKLDYSEILILYAVNSAVQIILEIPSGALADRWGRKPILMLGVFLQGSGYLSIAAGNTMAFYILGMALHGISMAFISGSDAAFMYDTLKAAGREGEFKRIEGRGYMYNLIGWGTGGLLGGLLAAKSMSLPFILSAMTSFMAFMVMGTCTEPPRRGDRKEVAHLIGSAFSTVRHNRVVRSVLVFSGIMFGVLLVAHKFSQPYLARADVALELFGPIYFVWLMGAALSSNYSEKVEKFLGRKVYFISLPVVTGGVIIYLGALQNIPGVFVALLYQFVWGSLRPQVNQIINQEVGSSIRATILSMAGFGGSIVYILASPVIGYLADARGFPEALLYLGGAVLVLGLLALIPLFKAFRRPVPW